ncbi:multifunctional conjugation protein TraI [mine drainage metagenome]|uniref:Multifunctional conjugation protein TraI n=1 Tax=mine drainage metagenome TaxID=410659 RepID=A0A1J5QRN1_9ZZZZ
MIFSICAVLSHQFIDIYNSDTLNHLSPFMMTFMSYKRLSKGANAGKYYTDSANDELIEDHSIDDYFTQAKGCEPSGVWFDPHGVIEGIQHGCIVNHVIFSNLLAGRSPQGKKLTQTVDGAHTAGFDATFSVPKSVSAIWAVASDLQREAIESALARANEDALLFLSERAGVSRRGGQGVRNEAVRLIAATWPHSSNRNGDPQRHFHNIIFNTCQHLDGTFGTIESKHIMLWQVATGAYFRAAVAHHLHQAFPGLQFKKDDKGSFIICDVKLELIEFWSSRRNEINELIAEGGLEGTARQRDEIWAKTRINKKYDYSPAIMQDRWLLEADTFSFNVLSALKEGQSNPIIDDGKWRSAGVALTRDKSMFTEQSLYRYVSEQSIGAPLAEIKRRVAEVKIGMVKLGADGKKRTIYSTLDMFKAELSLLTYAKQLSTDGKHSIDQAAVNTAIAKNTRMSDEQAAAIHHVCSQGSMKVVESSAGEDKSDTLHGIRFVFEAHGYEMMGLALMHSDAHRLQKNARIKSCEISDFLIGIENASTTINDKTIIVLGDYSLVNSEFADQLLKIVYVHGAKLIITGEGMNLNAIPIEPTMDIIMKVAGAVRIGEILSQKDVRQSNNVLADISAVALDKLDAYSRSMDDYWLVDSIKRQYFRHRSERNSTLDYLDRVDAVLITLIQTGIDCGLRKINNASKSTAVEFFKKDVFNDLKVVRESSSNALSEAMKVFADAMQKYDVIP